MTGLNQEELKAIFRKFLTDDVFNKLTENKVWEEFGDFDNTLDEIYKWALKTMESDTLDPAALYEKIKEIDAQIMFLSKSVKVQGGTGQSFFGIFGDMGGKHPAYIIFKYAMLLSLFMALRRFVIDEFNNGKGIFDSQEIKT